MNLTLSNPSAGLGLGTRTTATVTVDDDEEPITAEFAQASYEVSEGGSTTRVVVNLSRQTPTAVSVQVTADSGKVALSGPGISNGVLSFAANTDLSWFLVSGVDDADSADEAVNLTLSNPSAGLGLGTRTTATVTVDDDEEPVTVEFARASYEVAEGSATTVTVNVTGRLGPGADVRVTAESGKVALSGSALSNGVLSFSPGAPSASFTVTGVEDADSADETVNLTLSNPSAGLGLGTRTTATVTVDDDEEPITAEFAQASYEVSEGGPTKRVVVNLSRRTPTAVSVQVTAESGKVALSGPGISNGVLSFAANTDLTWFLVAGVDDADSADEAVNLTLSNPSAGLGLGTRTTATVTVDDDEEPVTVEFARASYEVAEGSTATVTVNVTGRVGRGADVRVTAESGKVALSGSALSNGVLSFSPGAPSASFTVTGVEDADLEDETVNLTLSNPSAGLGLGTRTTATVTVDDDEEPVTVEFARASYEVAEGSTATVTVNVTGRVGRGADVRVTAESGKVALSGSALSNGVLSFSPGAPSASFTVTGVEDADSDDETVNLTLSNPSAGLGLGTTTTATVSVRDDDEPVATISFGGDTYTVAEGGEVQVSVVLSRPHGGPAAEEVRVSASTRRVTVSPSLISIAPEAVDATVAIRAAEDDGGAEETVTLALEPVSSRLRVAGGPATTTVVVTDNDGSGPVSGGFSANAYTVDEGGETTVTLTLNRSPAAGVTPSVRVTAGPGLALRGLGAGNRASFGGLTATFTVAAANDADFADEKVRLDLSDPVDLDLRGSTTATVTVRDDDVPAPDVTVSFQHDTYRVAEGERIQVAVVLSAAATVEIPLRLSPGPGTDYTVTVGNTTYSAGREVRLPFHEASVAAFTLAAMPDADAEGDEAVTLRLSLDGLTGYVAGPPDAVTVTIVDRTSVPALPASGLAALAALLMGIARRRRSRLVGCRAEP